jgi:hypothetical protein
LLASHRRDSCQSCGWTGGIEIAEAKRAIALADAPERTVTLPRLFSVTDAGERDAPVNATARRRQPIMISP